MDRWGRICSFVVCSSARGHLRGQRAVEAGVEMADSEMTRDDGVSSSPSPIRGARRAAMACDMIASTRSATARRRNPVVRIRLDSTLSVSS